jgi:adenylate cyclase
MNQFLAELRRRNVFRVAAAYLVGGWLVLQIVGAIEASAGLPAWTDGMALVVLIIGLPIALVIAWAFELTPDGLKKTPDAPDDVVEARGVSVFDYALLGGLVLVIVGIGAQALFMTPPETRGPRLAVAEAGEVTEVVVEPDAGPAENSIAVLAFADLSPAGDQEYFSDGMAEEILNVLVRVDGLAITSRTSAFQFKGQDIGIPEIADQLNVRHIVEGSVRKAGDTIRITAQLIDTQTDAHLWSQTYDSPLTAQNVFEIQDEISTAIVVALSEALGVGDVADIEVETATANLDAYDLYLRGQALFYQRSSANFYEIVDLFEQSVAADPEYSRGWAALAMSYAFLPSWVAVDDKADIYARALEAADRASALDDGLALPYLARSSVAQDAGDFERSQAALAQARAREPDSLQVVYLSGYSWMLLGYLDRAIEAFEAALTIDPDYQIARRHLARSLTFSGDVERGMELFEISYLAGQGAQTFDFVSVYVGLGEPMKAFYLLETWSDDGGDFAYVVHPYHRWTTDPDYTWTDYRAALISAYEQQFGRPLPYDIPERYEDGITDRNAFNYRSSAVSRLWNPFLVDRQRPDLRDRYFAARKQKMRNMGLVAFWQANGFPSQCRAVGTDDFECD